MKVFALILLMVSKAWGGICTLDEIRRMDTAYLGQHISSYPTMTRAATYAPILAYIPQYDKAEDPSYWTTSFVGALGALYFAMKNRKAIDCDDSDSASRRRYSPTEKELYNYHEEQKAMFWETYTWTSIWVAGILMTTQHSQKKTAAIVALILPWSYGFSGRWTPWTEDFQLGFYPDFRGDLTAGISFKF